MPHHGFSFRRILFVLLLVFMLGVLLMFVFADPQEIILSLGVRNSLVVAFFVSFVGAFTSLTYFSVYPVIIALVAGQMHPLLVGAVAGMGMAAGDLLFFVLGYSARDLTSKRGKTILNAILDRIQRLRTILAHGLIFFYVAFTPFPNNLLSGSLAFVGYPFRKMVVPLIMGDLAFCLLFSWLSFRGVSLILF